MHKIPGMAQKPQPRSPGVEARGMSPLEYSRWWRAVFSESVKARDREYWKKNKERLTAMRKLRPKRTREKAREYRKNWFSKPQNREKRRLYEERTRERRNLYQRKYLAAKRRTPRGNLDHRMSTGVSAALRGRKAWRRWQDLVGYTVEDLATHLESQFTAGMTWEKLMCGEIHIDHKIPKSKFNYTAPEDIEFKRCWALENLQPMWSGENQRKWARITHPTQMGLGI